MNRLRTCLVVPALFASLVVGCANVTPSDASQPPEPVTRAWSAEESNAARAAMARAYANDPVEYWAVHGLPALARGADLRANDGVANPNAVFDEVMKGFEPDRFTAACGRGEVHPMICGRATANGDAALGLPDAIGEWLLEGGDLTTRGLRELVTTSFTMSKLSALEPVASKEADELPPVENVVCVTPDAPEEATDALTWSKVAGTAELAGDGPNGKCVTQAVGICSQRLGLHGATVTPEAWQKLSTELGVTATSGGSIAGMKTYFEGKGYAFSEAWTGPRESATTEAQRALARGCDVFLWYNSGDAATHIEVVNGIDTTNRPDGEALVTTNSWGRTATTKVSNGTYSEKSDRDRYGDTSRFAASEKATFYYACAR
ncbi:MAG: hypothetical protein KIT84_24800 [Labilithrix sp.]|nr:hypothetical protein [Labilithrix sp.]MCW5814270.1 hypothetical protein [Labilithrix sp.]